MPRPVPLGRRRRRRHALAEQADGAAAERGSPRGRRGGGGQGADLAEDTGAADALALESTGDPLGDLCALRDQAAAALAAGDAETARLRFRGVVHESDALLRAHYASESASKESAGAITNPRFHAVYAAALHQLGLMADGDEALEFLAAAEERFDAAARDQRDLFFFEHCGRLQIDKASIELINGIDMWSTSLDKALDCFARLFPEDNSGALSDSLVEILRLVMLHAELHGDDAARKMQLLQWIRERLIHEGQADAPHTAETITLVGEVDLALANCLLDGNDDTDEDYEVPAETLQEAAVFLREAHDLMQRHCTADSDPAQLLVRAEVALNLANCTGDDAMYGACVFLLKQAREHAPLPERFASVLDDLEDGDQEQGQEQ